MPRHILLAGSIAGVLDILAAFAIHSAAPPGVILQSIASGLLGPAAFRGGVSTAALGLLLHFVIATTVAALYFSAARVVGALVRRPVLSGAAYGVAVYLVMNTIVLPLSRLNMRPQSRFVIFWTVVAHIVCVGVPIALVARRAARLTPARV